MKVNKVSPKNVVKQPSAIEQLRIEKDKEILALQVAIAEQTERSISDKLEIQLAIAEIAELKGGM